MRILQGFWCGKSPSGSFKGDRAVDVPALICQEILREVSEETPEEFDERMGAHLEHLVERVNLLFAYHFCSLEFEQDPDFDGDVSAGGRSYKLKTIQNACLHTSLIGLRDLDDFFSPRNKQTRTDDLRAADFGCRESRQFLSREDRDLINKLIAHTTTLGAPMHGYRWDILELVAKAVAQVDSFLDWIRRQFSDHYELWTTAIAAQSINRKIFDWIQGESDRQQNEAEQ
jgi:hypothetical protein